MARGWVYVITNKAMPGLVKVGFSMKDPELRAEELYHTGSPHPYRVEYELLIEGPYAIEQKTHKILSTKREGKEWFRCSQEEAIAAIKSVAGVGGISEAYKGAEREKTEAIHRQNVIEQEDKQRREIAEKEAESQIVKEETALRLKHHQDLVAKFPPTPFWQYWLGSAVAAFIGVQITTPKITDSGAVMSAALIGLAIASVLQGSFQGKKQASKGYVFLQSQQKIALAAVRERIMPCPHCKKNLRFDRVVVLACPKSAVWRCPICKGVITPPE